MALTSGEVLECSKCKLWGHAQIVLLLLLRGLEDAKVLVLRCLTLYSATVVHCKYISDEISNRHLFEWVNFLWLSPLKQL